MILDDNLLIKKVQKGDMSAFEELISKYDRQVLNIAYSFRNNSDDAKDIYQEVFLRVFKGIKKFRFESEFSTWLYRIATNVCISYQNKIKKHKVESLDIEISGDEYDSISSPVDFISGDQNSDLRALNSDVNKFIIKAMDTLPPKQKLAFSLKHTQGYKIKEIAVMMDCKEGTIKRYLFNATNKLREILSPVLSNY